MTHGTHPPGGVGSSCISVSVHPPRSHLTRREALTLGAAAGAVAMTGIPGATLATAAAATVGGPGGPSYLRRGSYLDRVGQVFMAGDHVLRLIEVADVEGARANRALVGRDEVFALRFSGVADVIDAGIHVFDHEQLGPFPLFISAVGRPAGTRQTYEATIDRTVRIQTSPPRPPSPSLDVTPEAGEQAEIAPPTDRDLAIIAERRAAALAPARRKSLRAARAGSRLRGAYAKRARFKRRLALERRRLRRAQRGWLRRHGR